MVAWVGKNEAENYPRKRKEDDAKRTTTDRAKNTLAARWMRRQRKEGRKEGGKREIICLHTKQFHLCVSQSVALRTSSLLAVPRFHFFIVIRV